MKKIMIGGFPCTKFSIAQTKDRETKPFEGEGWELFMNCVYAKEKYKPDYFLFENNYSISKDLKKAISHELGVENYMIDSSLVSAQSRKREYWFNWICPQPEDRGIFLKDIALPDVAPVALHNLYGGFDEQNVRVFERKSPTIRTSAGGGHIPSFVKKDLIYNEKALAYMDRAVKGGRTHWGFQHHSDIRNEKSSAVVANFFKGIPYNVFKDWDCIRKFHPIECERLQTLSDNYTAGVSDTQRYKCIGNGWTAEVIIHILKRMNIPLNEEIIVLSMYDGIGTGRYCFDKMGYTNIKYHAYEIDKYAKQVAMSNYPDIIQMGDAFRVREDNWNLGK